MVIKKIRPLFSMVVTTMNKLQEDVYEGSTIVATAGDVDEFQTVLEVGDIVKNIKPGDIVHVNPTRYKVVKHDLNSIKSDDIAVGYNIPTLTINGQTYMHLQSSDIDYVIEDYDDNDNPRMTRKKSNIMSLKDSIIK